jgi:hypothetical protein
MRRVVRDNGNAGDRAGADSEIDHDPRRARRMTEREAP